jgi:hypothetical protein
MASMVSPLAVAATHVGQTPQHVAGATSNHRLSKGKTETNNDDSTTAA